MYLLSACTGYLLLSLSLERDDRDRGVLLKIANTCGENGGKKKVLHVNYYGFLHRKASGIACMCIKMPILHNPADNQLNIVRMIAKDGANHICANANGKLNNDGNACTVLGRITL
jgi:hypothetical protein